MALARQSIASDNRGIARGDSSCEQPWLPTAATSDPLAETTHVFIDRRRLLQKLRRAAEEVRFSAAANSPLGAFVGAAATGLGHHCVLHSRSFSSDSQSRGRYFPDVGGTDLLASPTVSWVLPPVLRRCAALCGFGYAPLALEHVCADTGTGDPAHHRDWRVFDRSDRAPAKSRS